jgi:hypothetical protein
MNTEDFKASYLERLIKRLVDDGGQPTPEAESIATELYSHCPRFDMAEEYQQDPEAAADVAYEDWEEADDLDEDDEWAGDEDQEENEFPFG